MINKYIIAAVAVLSVALFFVGKLSINSKVELGKQIELTKQWQVANELSVQAFNNQVAESEAAQARMVELSSDYQKIKGQLHGYQTELKQLQSTSVGTNCIADAEWLLINKSAGNSTVERLHSD